MQNTLCFQVAHSVKKLPDFGCKNPKQRKIIPFKQKTAGRIPRL